MSGVLKRLAFVVPVYNVAGYLPDLIESIERQRHGTDDLEVIAVDDGSTDGSLAILRGWENRHPGLVTVVARRNQGVAAARNAGLDLVRAPWVGFIDAADMLDHWYVDAVTRYLGTRPDCATLATRTVYLDETSRGLRDEHPMPYPFRDESRVVDLEESPDGFHTALNCSLFHTSTLKELSLRFDPRIRPHFEDTHFTARFLLHAGARIGFVADAICRHRLRSDASSLSEGRRFDPETFTTVPRFGYLPCLAEAVAVAGRAPRWLQNMILDSVAWQLASAEAHEPSAAVGEVGAAYVRSIREVRTHLEDTVIDAFPLPHLSHLARDVLLRLNDDSDWHSASALIDRSDPDQGLARLVYRYKGQRPNESLTRDGRPIGVRAGKTQGIAWFGENLLNRRIAWIPLGDRIQVRLDGDPVVLDDATVPQSGVSLPSTARHAAIASARRVVGIAARVPHRFAGAWLLMDRAHLANDNAEHLFRHIRRHRPDINAWFVVERNTPAWNRLVSSALSDRLLALGSWEWKLALLTCVHAASSQLDIGTVTPPRVTRLRERPVRYAYLRHGFSTRDQSAWLNPAPIDLLVTSSALEREAILRDGSPYLLTGKEVRLTGMPRLDRLLELGRAVSPRHRDLLLVAPTWRESLTRNSAHWPMRTDLAPGAAGSAWVREWSALLNSPRLAAVAQRHALRIAYLPHPLMASATPALDLDDSVLVLGYDGVDVQRVFARTALFVTDYSSVAFDLGYIDRPVVYFQFDQADVAGGRVHLHRPGWFDDRRDGLGPVTENLDAALDAIARVADGGLLMEERYLQRVQSLFPQRDGGCSARVTAAIEESVRHA